MDKIERGENLSDEEITVLNKAGEIEMRQELEDITERCIGALRISIKPEPKGKIPWWKDFESFFF